MKSEFQYENNKSNDKKDICDILLIPKYYSTKNIVLIYIEQIEQAEPGNWTSGNIIISQRKIKRNINIFLEIGINDKVLIATETIVFLAEIIQLLDDGFAIRQYAPILEISELEKGLRTEIRDAINNGKALSIIHNREEFYNLYGGFVLVDEELHINIYTEAEDYLFNDLTDLLCGIREMFGFQHSFEAYIKIKLCSPGFILLTIASGIEFVNKNAVGIALIWILIFGGDIKTEKYSVSLPSVMKGIQFFVNGKKNKQKEILESEYKKALLEGVRLDNQLKKIELENYEKEVERIANVAKRLEEIRDKMDFKRGKGRKEYLKVLDEAIYELGKKGK